MALGQRRGRAKPCELVCMAARGLGVNVPVSTIECITGGARAHGLLEGGPVKPLLQRGAHGLNGCHNAVRSFTIACIGDGLATAAVGPIAQFGHHHDRLGLAAAADRERASQRPALDSYGELHASGTMTGDVRRAQGSPAASRFAGSAVP